MSSDMILIPPTVELSSGLMLLLTVPGFLLFILALVHWKWSHYDELLVTGLAHFHASTIASSLIDEI